MKRRTLLQAAAGVGLVAGVGAVGRYGVLAPPPSGRHAPVDELAAELVAGLSPAARAKACVAYDHPLRQYFNRGLWIGGLRVNAATLGWNERRLLADILHAGVSDAGRSRLPHQDSTHWIGVNMLDLLVCGEPAAGPYQLVLSGVHLNLRLGSTSPDGAAFGGTQVYGDQRGNGRVGLPNNVYRYQLEAAQRFRAALTAAERERMRVARAPAQVNVGVQGRAGRFDGLPLADLDHGKRELARSAIAGILDTYAEDHVAYAWQCLERNGGVEALHVADYAEDFEGGRQVGADAPSQIFRFEGPAAVFHFRGEPHVHAFLNVAMDGERPLSVGDVLGENPTTLEGEELRQLFATAMRTHAEADIAYYPVQTVVGRLRAGTIRTGDVWTAESWVDELAVVEADGGDLMPDVAAVLRARGIAPQTSTPYRIATTGYLAREAAHYIGRVRARRSLGLLRDAVAAHVRAHGFARDA
jgi:hypothetical protein